jgi:hypothetical protein
MKYTKIIFFLTTILLFSSCKKEEPLRPNNTVVSNSEVYEFIDIDWVLSDSRFYMENLDNGDKNFYDHFGSSQFQSTLDPISGADIPFDSISQGVTTWRFTSNNFILNSVKYYEFTHTENTVVAVGMENGSSRPMTIIDIDDVSITFKVHEAYGSLDGINYAYYSTLTFVRAGETCSSCQPNSDYGYVYQGVINDNVSINGIIGTKWVVTKYYDGFSDTYPNDTLDFYSGTQYRINSGTPTNYTLYSVFGSNMSELTLYGFYTIGGDYSGMVPDNFVTNGQINSVSFTDIFNTNNNKLVWMVRIQ